jgi:hypothetical protein
MRLKSAKRAIGRAEIIFFVPAFDDDANGVWYVSNKGVPRFDGKLVNLAPGMAVTIEIKTGTRRIIEYLMSPLLRYRQERLRER